jgi:hypothetical protein
LARRAGTHLQATGSARKFPPYLVLLRVGFTMPRALQRERCALTAPFHPYRALLAKHAAVFSLWHWPYPGLETWTPDVIRHTALRSSDFPPPRNITRTSTGTRAAAAVQLASTSRPGRYPAHCPAEFGLSSPSRPAVPENAAREAAGRTRTSTPAIDCA